MDWLTEQYKRVQEHKLKQEKTIQYLKQLYKPWPAYKEQEKTGQEKQSSLNTDKTSSAKSVGVSDASLTAEEKEGLLLMDQLLSKAQRARDIQKKLEEPKKSRVKEVEQRRTKTESGKKNLQNSTVTSKPDGAERSVTGNAVIDKSDRQLSEKSKLSNKEAVPNIKSGSKVKPLNRGVATSGAKTVEKTERTRVSQRPQSSSGHRKVIPVHASAPFQTNPNLMSTKLQTTYRAATAKTFAKSRSAGSRINEHKGASRVDTALTAPNHPKTGKCDENKNSKLEIQGNIESKTVHDTFENPASLVGRVSDDFKSNESFLHEKLQAMTVDENSAQNTDASCQGTENKQGPKLFNLKKDGATLSVPNKLKKLMYLNRKLRQKLYTQNVTQKVSSPQASAEFPEHLQHSLGDEDAQVTQLQAKQAQHILQTYNSLLHMLDSLHLDHISADSNPADIYYCKKMVEYILLTFQEMEQHLHTSDFRNLKSAVIYSGCQVPKIPITEPSSMSVWYDKNTYTGGHSSAPVYQYHSYKQLETYMDLVFKVQILQLQIDVMDTVARLLLPLLQTLDPGTSEFAQVLRAGYSLMSINCNNMPVVVRDTIPEDSVSNIDEDETH